MASRDYSRGQVIRVSEETVMMVNKMNEICEVPKGKIIRDAVTLLKKELTLNDFNYSKILERL